MAQEVPAVRLIIISVPPGNTAASIRRCMERFAAVGGCRRALEYPPHVTLRTGALVPQRELPDYVEGFRRHLADQEPVEITTSDFVHAVYSDDQGVSRHFFGYNVVLTPQLRALYDHLCDYRDYMKSEPGDFWPHLSIAYHDIDSAGAERIESLLEENPDAVPGGFRWRCGRVGLYRRIPTPGDPALRGAATLDPAPRTPRPAWTEAASITL